VELEQATQKRPRVVAAEVATLDERNGVREIRERQPMRESRPVRALRGVRGGDELARGGATKTAAPPQLVGPGHGGSLAPPGYRDRLGRRRPAHPRAT
jgi:hypothetical protein